MLTTEICENTPYIGEFSENYGYWTHAYARYCNLPTLARLLPRVHHLYDT